MINNTGKVGTLPNDPAIVQPVDTENGFPLNDPAVTVITEESKSKGAKLVKRDFQKDYRKVHLPLNSVPPNLPENTLESLPKREEISKDNSKNEIPFTRQVKEEEIKGGDIGTEVEEEKQRPLIGRPAPPPARKQAEDVPFDIIIESDLSLRRRLNLLKTTEEELSNIGSIALEKYEDIFEELEAEIEKAEQQTLAQIDQLEYDPENVSYTKERDVHIMKEKNPDKITKDFEKCINSLLRTDVVIRPSFRKDTYLKIHSFQWKSSQIHTYNLMSNVLETTIINTQFNVPLFSRSIAVENGDIYLIGGLVKPYYLKTTFFLDEASNVLVKRANMNLPRADHSLIYLAGYIYAVGSYVHNRCNSTCERYDIYKNKWMPIASLNTGRAGIGLCSVDNAYLYAFGGRNDKRIILPAIECYSIASDEWK